MICMHCNYHNECSIVMEFEKKQFFGCASYYLAKQFHCCVSFCVATTQFLISCVNKMWLCIRHQLFGHFGYNFWKNQIADYYEFKVLSRAEQLSRYQHSALLKKESVDHSSNFFLKGAWMAQAALREYNWG